MTTAFMVFGISAISAHLLRLVPGRARPAPWHGTRSGLERRRRGRERAYEAGEHSSRTNVRGAGGAGAGPDPPRTTGSDGRGPLRRSPRSGRICVGVRVVCVRVRVGVGVGVGVRED